MESQDSIRRAIMEIVADVAEIPVEQVSPDAKFADLDIDSLRGLRIVAAVEQRWSIVISEEQIAKIRSLPDVFALLDAQAPRSG